MKNLRNSKTRFYNLLESTMGNVKPLISESVVGQHTVSDWVIRPDGSFVLKGLAPKNEKCYGVPADEIFYHTDKKKGEPEEYWKKLETSLKGQFATGGANYQTLRNHFINSGCPFSIRKTPKTEEDLTKDGYYLVKGDKGDLVKKIQMLLVNSAEGYATMFSQQTKPGKTPFDGYFGSITYSVVKEFQKDNSIPQTGKVGKLTWAKLKDTPIKYDWDITKGEFVPIGDKKEDTNLSESKKIKNKDMKKVIKLTESDLIKLVKRVIKEQEDDTEDYVYSPELEDLFDNVSAIEMESKTEREFDENIESLFDQYSDEIEDMDRDEYHMLMDHIKLIKKDNDFGFDDDYYEDEDDYTV